MTSMERTTGSESDLAICNYALGYADGLVAAHRRRNEPTEGRFREPFRRGLSDAECRRPFGPPPLLMDEAQRDGG